MHYVEVVKIRDYVNANLARAKTLTSCQVIEGVHAHEYEPYLCNNTITLRSLCSGDGLLIKIVLQQLIRGRSKREKKYRCVCVDRSFQKQGWGECGWCIAAAAAEVCCAADFSRGETIDPSSRSLGSSYQPGPGSQGVQGGRGCTWRYSRAEQGPREVSELVTSTGSDERRHYRAAAIIQRYCSPSVFLNSDVSP